jgi:ferric-dicitrate binding protein FerR (iron transport regulator)
MTNKSGTLKYSAFCLLMAVLAVPGMGVVAKAGLRAPAEPTGKLTVVGKVTVDGKPAASGDVFKSGGVTTTAKGSSAVVSLGKLGRVEVSESSTMKISFTDSSIIGSLDHGRANTTAAKGTAANISIKDGEVVANGTEATAFTVDTESGNVCVIVQRGQVEWHAGAKVTKIAKGKHFSIGKPCNFKLGKGGGNSGE